jgi:putative transposase
MRIVARNRSKYYNRIIPMLLAHRIRLDPDTEQRDYFMRAAGTARRVWNWALAEWLRQRDTGGNPNAYALKRRFNAIKYFDPGWLDDAGQPWLKNMHRDSHAQPFAHLARAWARFFENKHAGQPAHPPRFKKKGRCRDSFYVANDKFRFNGDSVVLPKIGKVALREVLRLDGKIMGANVQREADHWYLSVQVELTDVQARRRRVADDVTGVDFGLKAAATLSTSEAIPAPMPLRTALRRLRVRGRRLSRKLTAAKQLVGIDGAIPKGTRLPVSRNRQKASRSLARLHSRIASIRIDFTHKLTTRLCRENQTVVIEDLNVKGMLSNHKLARVISDVGFGRMRSQLVYKAKRYGTTLIVADPWYPSSKLCSTCSWKYEALSLAEREWVCQKCGACHDRDHNAAINLQRLATAVAGKPCSESALPGASSAATSDTAAGIRPAVGGKVTPVRHEYGQQDGSGQEENRVHL